MRLNEYLIKLKTKTSNLAEVKNLNCWGMDLTDISIVERMPNIEVLSLSVNAIETLQPLKRCLKLKTLYIRKNNIREMKEVAYLQNLPMLANLVLSENPLCESLGMQYRAAVLRCLPNLKMLDEKKVMPSEREEAAIKTSIDDAEEPACTDAVQEEHEKSNLELKNSNTSLKSETNDGNRSCCQQSASFGSESNPAQSPAGENSDPDGCSILSERACYGSTGSGSELSFVAATCQPSTISIYSNSIAVGAAHQLGAGSVSARNNPNAPNPFAFSGGDSKRLEEGRISGQQSMYQEQLMTAALCIVDTLDQQSLKVLDRMITVYLRDNIYSE